MSEVEELERKVQGLSAEDLAKFRAWFSEYDWQLWDQHIEADLKAGKLNKLISQVGDRSRQSAHQLWKKIPAAYRHEKGSNLNALASNLLAGMWGFGQRSVPG